MRVTLFGDGQWASDSLVQVWEAGHDVAAVVLRARPSGDELEIAAHRLRIPVLQPRDVNAIGAVAQIADLEADVNLSIAYNQIFAPAIRATATWFLNVHAGKLPQYRGRNVINWAIINGEPEIGLTVHLVDDGIDTGDVLLQHTLPIAWTATYGDVLADVVHAVPGLVIESLAAIASGCARPCPQAPGGTYFCGRRGGDEWLDWTDSSTDIYNKIRGITHPGPGARTWLGTCPVIIWRATYDPPWPRYHAIPGEVVGREPGRGVFVKTSDSTVLIEEVQIGTRPAQVPAWPIGTRLGVDAGAVLHALLARSEARTA